MEISSHRSHRQEAGSRTEPCCVIYMGSSLTRLKAINHKSNQVEEHNCVNEIWSKGIPRKGAQPFPLLSWFAFQPLKDGGNCITEITALLRQRLASPAPNAAERDGQLPGGRAPSQEKDPALGFPWALFNQCWCLSSWSLGSLWSWEGYNINNMQESLFPYTKHEKYDW